MNLWESEAVSDWQRALDSYSVVISNHGKPRLEELDRWYREELPRLIAGRVPASVTLDELVKVTEWKMMRGVWRPRNLALVRGNDPAAVAAASESALAAVPHPTRPIAALSELAGVGPATASGVMAAAAPDVYPFFDELAAAQVPQTGKLAFTPKYYAWYAEALRQRAARLGKGWTPVLVERALWANSGGKVGAAAATSSTE